MPPPQDDPHASDQERDELDALTTAFHAHVDKFVRERDCLSALCTCWRYEPCDWRDTGRWTMLGSTDA